MSPTFTEILPSTKSSKHNGIEWTPAETGPGGFLELWMGKKFVQYLVVEFGTPWHGRAFHFAKVTTGTDKDSSSYDVFCGFNSGERRCTCKGFEFTGNCKHIEAAVAIWENGWLPQDQANGEQDVSSTEINDPFSDTPKAQTTPVTFNSNYWADQI